MMKMTRIEKRFVNRQKKAEGNIKKLEPYLQTIDLTKIKTVLELGCGIGFVSTYLAETYNFVVYGTDYDSEQVHIAEYIQPERKNLFFRIEDATQLTFHDASIDLVLSQNVFHHIPKWDTALQEISRILCPGGYLIWLDLTFSKFIKSVFLPFVENYGLYTIEDIRQSFEKCHFDTLSEQKLAHGPLKQYHFLLQKLTFEKN